MLSFAAVGVLVLMALSILCFAAYKLRAKSFEVSTSVGELVSFSFKIISTDDKGPATDEPSAWCNARLNLNAEEISRGKIRNADSSETACDHVVLLGRDAHLAADDEVSLN